MNRARLLLLLAFALLAFLYLFHLNALGLLGPDEPRYASIGRAMHATGDWITPQLNGQPWLEKPPLLYWLIGISFRAGFSPDWAPRLPNALLSLVFLALYFTLLRAEFSPPAAAFATLLLALSAGWLAFSHAAVTDLPLSVTLSLALLLALRHRRAPSPYLLPLAAVFLALAVLAKGLVPLVLALPVAWLYRSCWRRLLAPRLILLFLAVALPWYALATLRHGTAFLEEFFLRHHLSRFATDALQHRQPFWFYLPVLVAGLFPWSFLLLLFARPSRLWGAPRDDRRVFLLLWVLWGLVFFSLSVNKLPGYLLPLLPPLCALLGIALAETRSAPILLAATALLSGLLPLIGAILPAALRSGIRAVPLQLPFAAAGLLPPLALALAVYLLERRRHRPAALALLALVFSLGVIGLKLTLFPLLDRTVSIRHTWRENAWRRDSLCVENLHRALRYGLDYYTLTPLPDCETSPRPLRVTNHLTRLPRVEPARNPVATPFPLP